MTFTPDQERALQLDRHVAVVANAGSGKTRVLTERFARIVAQGHAQADDIVAITFTNKAAAEMRRRVHDRLHADDTPAAQRALRHLGKARISTFHAFCSTLLRSHADAAGLQPDFGEVSQREAITMHEEAVRSAVNAALSFQDSRRQFLLMAFDDLGIRAVEATLKRLVASAETTARWQAWSNSAQSDVLLEARIQQCGTMRRQQIQDSVDAILAVLAAEAHSSARAMEAQSACRRAATVLTADLSDADVAVLQETFSSLYTKTGQPRSDKKNPWLQSLPNVDKRILNDASYFRPRHDIEERALQIAHAIIATAAEATRVYAALKRERNGVDFDDMMLLTASLLEQHNDVAQSVRQSIRFLMVDEFQDTNPIQYQIVRLLVPQLDGPAATSPNVFIVGDPKQSIYGFREADVRLFADAQKRIALANQRNGCSDDGNVVLAASFRMKTAVAAAVNTWCASAMAGTTEFDVPYSPLVVGRTNERNPGSAECLVLEVVSQTDDAADEDIDALTAHLEQIADCIVAWCSDADPRMIDDATAEGGTRRLQPGDCAILLRRGATIDVAMSVLASRSLPFQAHGGKAFYTRPEIVDVRSLLRFCMNPHSDIDLAACMRSAMFDVHDSAMLECSLLRNDGESLWDAACRLTDHGEAPEGIGRMTTTLREALADVTTVSIPAMIRRTMHRSGWYSTIAGSSRRDMILGNVDKLLARIRTEQESGATLRDCAAMADGSDTTEADSTPDADPNAVQILTIHASKGLEFPCVFVADIASRGQGQTEPILFTDSLGVTVNVPESRFSPEAPLDQIVDGRPVSHDINSSLLRSANEAEDRRLLYVALTRARDICVPCLQWRRTSKGAVGAVNGLQRLLWPVLFGDTPPSDRTSLPVVAEIRTLGDGLEKPVIHTMSVPLLHRQSVRYSAVHYAEVRPAEDALDLSASLATRTSLSMISVTDVLDPLIRSYEPDAATVDEFVSDGAGPAYGTMVHFLLQHAYSTDAPADNLEEWLHSRIANRSTAPRIQELAVAETMAVVRHPATELLYTHRTTAQTESARTAILDATAVYGVMDVLIRTSETAMEVWDWKTNRTHSESDVRELVQHYLPQLECYAWLCFATDSALDTVTTRLFFTERIMMASQHAMHSIIHHRSDVPTLENHLRSSMDALLRRRMRRLGIVTD